MRNSGVKRGGDWLVRADLLQRFLGLALFNCLSSFQAIDVTALWVLFDDESLREICPLVVRLHRVPLAVVVGEDFAGVNFELDRCLDQSRVILEHFVDLRVSVVLFDKVARIVKMGRPNVASGSL